VQTPQEIQREMDRWNRRQEKIKMTFKKPEQKGLPEISSQKGLQQPDGSSLSTTELTQVKRGNLF
jgi:hypothetical protein